MQKQVFFFFLVGLGGMIGSILRFGVTLLTKNISVSLPYGTLISNIAGCFIIGIVMTLTDRFGLLSLETRIFLIPGLCGGFTTLSSLLYEVQKMIAHKELAMASLYCTATFAGSFLALLIGMTCVKLLLKA